MQIFHINMAVLKTEAFVKQNWKVSVLTLKGKSKSKKALIIFSFPYYLKEIQIQFWFNFISKGVKDLRHY